MAARIRAHDWAATPLGPVEEWPERLKHAVELMLAMPHAATVGWGPDLLQIYNDQSIPVFGRRHPGALGRPHVEGLAESAEAIVAARDRLFATGEAFTYVDQPFVLPGTGHGPVTRWFTGGWAPITDDRGDILGVLASGLDTTGRALAQAALRDADERHRADLTRQVADRTAELEESRDLLRATMDASTDMIEVFKAVRDEEGRIADFRLLLANRLAEARHGEAHGQRLLDRDPGVVPDGMFDNWTRVVETGEPARAERRFSHDRLDGWFLQTVVKLDDGVATTTRDITDQKRADAAITESETRLRTLLEGIPQLVWRSCDRGRWTWASPQWLRFTGQTQEETQGWGWLDVIHPDDRAATLEAWRDARPHGMLDTEYRILRARDRAWIWHRTRSVPVRDADGRIVEWLGTSTDIQGLRELQERQGVLVGELQHRTRNLIGVVRSVADKSLRASADLSDFRDRFGRWMEALSRVQGLLSRLSEGERVTFDALLGAELAAMDANGDGRVTLDGPAGVALRSGTVQTLALAIHELATNAVKYGALGQPGGRLRVAWRVLPPNGHPRPRLRIDWRETGVAMPPPGSPPQGTGQGRELIERALPYQLDAETTYVFADDGVDCSIIVPVSAHVSPEEPTHA